MYIKEFEDAMKACRFCFMCRHLSAVGNVTFSESDTPRGRALMLDKVTMNPDFLRSEAVVSTMYKSDLSACCRFHCVNHYDENGLVLAARRDIVEAGAAPEKVKALAKELAKGAVFKVAGKKGDTLYFTDKYTVEQPEISAAFKKIADAAKVPFMTISGGCLGKALKTLGFEAEAKKATAAFAKAVTASGAKVLVVSNPAAYDAVKNDFPALGVKLKCKVMHTAEFIAEKLGKLKLRKPAKKTAGVYYLESDFLKNYNGNVAAPREVLEKCGFTLKPFGTNNEESYSAGEGACVLRELDPCLVKLLAEKVASRCDDAKNDQLITASPYTRHALATEAKLNVKTIEEAVAALL